jgi:hypothetical protein
VSIVFLATRVSVAVGSVSVPEATAFAMMPVTPEVAPERFSSGTVSGVAGISETPTSVGLTSVAPSAKTSEP